LENPDYNQLSFDTIFYSFISIFTSVTLEGWTAVMASTQLTLSPWTFAFFIPLVFIGAFFLLNLTLAVIKSKFSEEHEKK
jgi:Ion transport protein